MVALLTSLLSDRSRTMVEEAMVDAEQERLVDHIRALNPTASREFLVTFRRDALELYLEHLSRTTHEPRGRSAVWTRPADTPAIVVRERRD